ncbi:hypothetical protein BDZ91DRAFT_296777 [Kalaharituber pfeilii]|nr:hypothetical protein BDZ91DRAFT_296777 [Kalaharituber pfeilii]
MMTDWRSGFIGGWGLARSSLDFMFFFLFCFITPICMHTALGMTEHWNQFFIGICFVRWAEWLTGWRKCFLRSASCY